MKLSMKLITVTCSLLTVISACAPSQPSPAVQVNVLATPSAPASETPAPPTPTFTPAPTFTPIGPTPTETLLPPLDLPTLEASEPALEIWDGLPTYLADSRAGFFFRVKYRSALWALTEDSYGQPALGHREIEYCILAAAEPRGLSPGMQVEHDLRKIGALYFEINVVISQGARQFVAYQATDTVIFTGFQVNFVDQIDACLADAEAVLATLTSVHETQATPIP